jgi:hypothetical protein
MLGHDVALTNRSSTMRAVIWPSHEPCCSAVPRLRCLFDDDELQSMHVGVAQAQRTDCGPVSEQLAAVDLRSRMKVRTSLTDVSRK